MKTFFQARSLRERVLLLAFALIAFGWWGPSALGRLGAVRRDARSLGEERATQRMWLDRRTEIEARAAGAARTLDPAKTLDASQTFAELNRMTVTAGLAAEIAAKNPVISEQLALHNVTVSIRRADLKALYGFYEQLSARAPYLGLEKCTISVERTNPGLLNAVFTVYSIETLGPAK